MAEEKAHLNVGEAEARLRHRLLKLGEVERARAEGVGFRVEIGVGFGVEFGFGLRFRVGELGS